VIRRKPVLNGLINGCAGSLMPVRTAGHLPNRVSVGTG
jgi:hypothetical protein